MAIKKLMVPFLDSGVDHYALTASAIFAQCFKAHLEIVHIRQRFMPTLPGNVYSPVIVSNIEENLEILTENAKQQAASLKKDVLGFCDNHSIAVLEQTEHTDDKGATASWIDLEGNLPDDLVKRARSADVAVLAMPADNEPGYHDRNIEDVVFRSGQPAMIVRAGQAMAYFPKTVVVAWDGGREAAHALSAAMPILEKASTVIMTAVGDLPRGATSVEQAAALLKLHGVHAIYHHKRVEKHEHAEEIFLADATKRNADLIVMGAYSHQRWRETMLGGFTRFMLKRSDMPLFMAH